MQNEAVRVRFKVAGRYAHPRDVRHPQLEVGVGDVREVSFSWARHLEKHGRVEVLPDPGDGSDESEDEKAPSVGEASRVGGRPPKPPKRRGLRRSLRETKDDPALE